ncbi:MULTISPECIES: AraC family transcriptional regulator [unclassified Variovorax]|jgi:AraC-like DNA-binding protein|uniref:AraC family transcriptional regulator n=1 Tax=unclassified Variovorax TaxID=663243 RepID=UPI000F7E2817|nr:MULTISPECIES: AraC family transcriptional regulator [unclassified Variovorax]RSZ44202.1 AraC family transcriptional regulator [Variovorax sp. 553]RSZ45142.1 AraC family transcriptional regulator [Variovorax sp. 679]
MATLNFSTDDLRPQDRFDHWCEARGRHMFGVTIELPRERRPAFEGRFQAVSIGDATVSNMRASSYQISRTSADIARVASQSLCIGLQVRGPGLISTSRASGLQIREGDLVVNHSDLPYAGMPMRTDGFDFRMLRIPLTPDLLLGARADDLFAEPLAPATPFLRPLMATFHALTLRPSDAPDAGAEVTHAARLALLARGRLPPGLPESRAALRSGFLHAARGILARDLRQPELSPATIARELGISLRQVHVLFEPTGQSFARTLTSMRLGEASRMLSEAPERSVTDIAYLCGFDSIATFYRVFRAAYAMTPRDARAAAQGE